MGPPPSPLEGAAGLPVVSSDLPEVRQVGLCKLARGTEDFVRKVDECLAEDAGPRLERAERIRHESWEARVEEIRAFVGEAMVNAGRAL